MESGRAVKRSKPLRRGGYIKRRVRVKPRNAVRRAKNHERAYGGETRLKWIAAQGCLVETSSVSDCAGDVANHHVKSGGTSRKADAEFIVPLCHAHHTELHGRGRRTFEWRHGLNLREEAVKIEKRWQSRHREQGDTQ